jgi:hypothetical protein
MGKAVDLTGQVFGEWTVLERSSSGKNRNSRWLCRCSCGAERVVYGDDLQRSSSKSCGHAVLKNCEICGGIFQDNSLNHHRLYCRNCVCNQRRVFRHLIRNVLDVVELKRKDGETYSQCDTRLVAIGRQLYREMEKQDADSA